LPRPNWSRPLPRPLKIPTVMDLHTLADVRELVELHLPAECRERDWRPIGCTMRLAAAPPSGADWIHEIKHDGFRVGMQLQTLVDVWAVMREFMA